MLPEKSASPAGSGTPVTSGRLERGGCPRVLEDGTVVLADTAGGRLLSLPAEPDGELRVLRELPLPLLGVAPLAGRDGAWLAAMREGFAVLPPADAGGPGSDGPSDSGPGDSGPGGGGPEWLARTEPLSCVASDPAGRMWAGTERGGVVRLTRDGDVVEALPPGTGPGAPEAVGGLAFSPDGSTLYVADQGIRVHRVDQVTHAVRFQRTLSHVPPEDGRPGAMATDGFGRLWCALYGGAAVRCFSPDGRLLLDVPVPAWQPSGICLTGDTMLLTTDRAGLAARGALDGAVLELTCTAPSVQTGAAVLTR